MDDPLDVFLHGGLMRLIKAVATINVEAESAGMIPRGAKALIVNASVIGVMTR